MATTTWTGDGSNNLWTNATNWDNGAPTQSLDAIIPDCTSLDVPLLESTVECRSLTMVAGADLNGNGNNLEIHGEADGTGVTQSGYCLYVRGKFTNNLDVEIFTNTSSNLDVTPSDSSKIRTLKINDSSALIYTLAALSLSGGLNVNQGTFNTDNNFALTTGSHINGNGTLACNASTITCGGQLTVTTLTSSGGSITCSDDFRGGTRTYSGNTAVSFTSNGAKLGGRNIVTGTHAPTFTTGRLYSDFDMRSGEVGNSTMNLNLNEDQTGDGADAPARDLYFYDFTLNAATNNNHKYTMGGDFHVANSLKMSGGVLDTDSTANHAITVVGSSADHDALEMHDYGKLILNGSTCSFGNVWYTAATATIDGDTSTITLTNGTTSGWVWYQPYGTFNYDQSTVINQENGKHIRGDFYNLTIDNQAGNAVSNRTIWHPANGSATGTMLIHGDLTIKEGGFDSDTNGMKINVTGNVKIEDGGHMGYYRDDDGTPETGTFTFGTLKVESGGKYFATSGTTYCKGEVDIGGTEFTLWVEDQNNSIDHNNGTWYFDDASLSDGSTNVRCPATLCNVKVDYGSNSLTSHHNMTTTGEFRVMAGTYSDGSNGFTIGGLCRVDTGATLNLSNSADQAKTVNTLLVEGTFKACRGNTIVNGGGDCVDFTAGTFLHNNGMVSIQGGNGTGIKTTGSAATDNFYDLEIDSSESDTATTSWLGDTTIEGDLTLVQGKFLPNTSSQDFTVRGNTFVTANASFGNLGSTQPSGDYIFGGMVTNKGGWFASTGVNKFKGGFRQLSTLGTANGTFNGDAELLQFAGTGGLVEGDFDDCRIKVDLDYAVDFGPDTNKAVQIDDGTATRYSGNGNNTWSAWIYPKGLGGNSNGRIFDKNTMKLYMATDSAGGFILKGDIEHGGGSDQNLQVVTNQSLQFNHWYHVAFIYEGTGNTAEIVVNGKVQTLSTDTAGVGALTSDTGNHTFVGNNASLNRSFDGMIADYQFWNTNLYVGNATYPHIETLASKIDVDEEEVAHIYATSVGTGGVSTANCKVRATLLNGSITDESENSNAISYTNTPTPVYDAFSLHVQDKDPDAANTHTKFGGSYLHINQGKLECLDLTSVNFDGSNDGMQVGSANFDIRTNAPSYTLSAWINPNDITGYKRIFFQEQKLSLAMNDAQIQWAPNYDTNTSTGNVLTADKWHHIVATYDTTANTRSIYVDGVLEKHDGDSSADKTGAAKLWIGCKDGTEQEFVGNIRDVRIYDHAFREADAQALYSGHKLTAPIHWWKMSENQANYISDNHAYERNYGTQALRDTGCLVKDVGSDQCVGTYAGKSISQIRMDGTNHATQFISDTILAQDINHAELDHATSIVRYCVDGVTDNGDATTTITFTNANQSYRDHKTSGLGSTKNFAWKLNQYQQSAIHFPDNNKILEVMDGRHTGANAPSKGDLEVSGRIQIDAEGTLSAPQGQLRHFLVALSSGYANNTAEIGTDGTFIHNEGEFVAQSNGNYTLGNSTLSSTANAITFWKFNMYSKTTGGSSGNTWARCPLSVTFEHTLGRAATQDFGAGSDSGSYVVWSTYYSQDIALETKFGTWYQSGYCKVNYLYSGSNLFSLVKYSGVSALYPAIWQMGNGAAVGINSGQDTLPDVVEIKNIHFDAAMGNKQTGTQDYSSRDPKPILKLTGPIEFDDNLHLNNANHTLDLNGQRLEVAGKLYQSNASTIKDTSSGNSLIVAKNINVVGSTNNISSTNRSNLILDNTGSAISDMFYSGTGTYWDNILIRDGNYVTYAESGSSSRENKLIVSGDSARYDVDHTLNTGDLTIGLGGEVRHNADIVVDGDYTTSGGLIDKSCWNFQGDSWFSNLDISENNNTTGGVVDSSALYSNQSTEAVIKNSITIEFWCRTEEDDSNKGLVSKYFTNNFWQYQIRKESEGYITFGRGNYSGDERQRSNYQVQSSTSIEDSKWHHIACVCDVPAASNDSLAGTASSSDPYYQTMRIYVDGKLEDIAYLNTFLDAKTESGSFAGGYENGFTIGTNTYQHTLESYGAGPFNGQMCELRIWGKPLTEAEILKYMWEQPASGTSGLVHYYKMNEGSNTYARWESGAASKGTNFGVDASGHDHARDMNLLMTTTASRYSERGEIGSLGVGFLNAGENGGVPLAPNNTTVTPADTSAANLQAENTAKYLKLNGGTAGSKKNVYYINGEGGSYVGYLWVSGHYNLVGVSYGGDNFRPTTQTKITGGVYNGANHSGTTGATLYYAGDGHNFSDLSGVLSASRFYFSGSSNSHNIPAMTLTNMNLDNFSQLTATGNWSKSGSPLYYNRAGGSMDFGSYTAQCDIMTNYSLLKCDGGSLETNSRIDGDTTSSYEFINNATLKGTGSSWFRVAPEADFQLIGKLEGYLIKNHGFGDGGGSQVTVLGPVVNCTIEDGTHPNRILQHHFTHDSKQALDLDAIDDRDILLEDPSIDNATELVGTGNG